MLRWVVLGLAIGSGAVAFGAAPGKSAFQSDFTELSGPGCVVDPTTEASAECPGLMGYRINVDREDGRTYLRIEKGGYTAVVPEAGALRFTSKLEWRRKGSMPLAVIVRAVIPGPRGEREVVLLQGLDGNVRMQGVFDAKAKNAAAEARARADRGRATPR